MEECWQIWSWCAPSSSSLSFFMHPVDENSHLDISKVFRTVRCDTECAKVINICIGSVIPFDLSLFPGCLSRRGIYKIESTDSTCKADTLQKGLNFSTVPCSFGFNCVVLCAFCIVGSAYAWKIRVPRHFDSRFDEHLWCRKMVWARPRVLQHFWSTSQSWLVQGSGFGCFQQWSTVQSTVYQQWVSATFIMANWSTMSSHLPSTVVYLMWTRNHKWQIGILLCQFHNILRESCIATVARLCADKGSHIIVFLFLAWLACTYHSHTNNLMRSTKSGTISLCAEFSIICDPQGRW